MDNETTKHLAAIGNFMFDYWQFFASLFAVWFAISVWYLRQLFVTKAQMNVCKDGLVDALSEHEEREKDNYLEFTKVNAHQHELINSKIDRLMEFLMSNGK